MIFNNTERNQEDKFFTSEDFSSLSLVGYSFYNCTFERCIFINSTLIDTKFYSCVFNECNWSFVTVKDSLLQDIMFNECKLVGIDFYKVNKIFFNVTFKQSNLLNCNFSDLNMKKTSFTGSRLKECIFKNTQLEEADFTNTDLPESVFRNCNLTKANFGCAKNYSLDISVNNVKKAQFSYREVMCLLKYFDIIINYKQ